MLSFLVRRLNCLTLFTTHYRWLVDEYHNSGHIALYTMLIEKPHPDHRSVIFLYKFVRGIT